jgi:hypothetical protein
MSVGGAEDPALSGPSRREGLVSLEEQVRRLKAPPVGDGSYYLGEPGVVSDEEYEAFLAQHYADRREGIA